FGVVVAPDAGSAQRFEEHAQVQKLNWMRPVEARRLRVKFREGDMADKSYGQFCPVAMAAEILCTRWTLLVVRELVCGSRRFNDLRRGVPRMLPALLSKRLKELEQAGIIRRAAAPGNPIVLEYELTDAGRELAPIVESIGHWGHRW